VDLSFEELASFFCGTWLVIVIIFAVWGWLSAWYEAYGMVKDAMLEPIPAQITSLLKGKTKVADLEITNVKILYLLEKTKVADLEITNLKILYFTCFFAIGIGFFIALPLLFNPSATKYHKNIGKNILLIEVLHLFLGVLIVGPQYFIHYLW